MSHRDMLGPAKGPLQLPRLGRRRRPVTCQAAGCPAGTGTPLAAAGTLESLEHGRAPATTHLIAFFIASYHAHSFDEGVAGVVDTRLDALVQGPAIWGCFVTEPGIDGWCHVAGHAVVVLPQVWVLGAVGRETDESFGDRDPSTCALAPQRPSGQAWAGELWGGTSSCSAYPHQQRPARSGKAVMGIAQRGQRAA